MGPRAKMASEESKEESLSFESVSALVVKYLSPVEQLSPFKVGQIQKLISDIAESAGNSELGGQIAPYFAIAQVIFLILFVVYFVIGVVALAVDAEAMDAPCAEDSWIWLYALLVIVIPTSIGVIIMCVASVFGCITLFGMGAALYADLTKKGDYESPGETKSPSAASLTVTGVRCHLSDVSLLARPLGMGGCRWWVV